MVRRMAPAGVRSLRDCEEPEVLDRIITMRTFVFCPWRAALPRHFASCHLRLLVPRPKCERTCPPKSIPKYNEDMFITETTETKQKSCRAHVGATAYSSPVLRCGLPFPFISAFGSRPVKEIVYVDVLIVVRVGKTGAVAAFWRHVTKARSRCHDKCLVSP